MRDRYFFLLVWVALSGIAGTWALSMPLYSGPDEPAHVIEAAGVVRGDALGPQVDQEPPFSVVTVVEAPRYLANATELPGCFAFQPAVPASCEPAMATGDAGVELTTTAGHYPPLYYALVGTPTLVLDGARAVYAMRALSVLVGGFVLAVGMVMLRRTSMRRYAVPGGMVALTPMAFFLLGIINPSGLEVALGFTAWAALLPVALDPRPEGVRGRLVVGALSLGLLVNVRASSPVWAIGILLVVVALMTRQRWSLVLRDRAWIAPVAIGTVGAAAAGAWLLVADPTRSLGGVPVPDYVSNPGLVVRETSARTSGYLREMIGRFGWLDTSPSFFTLAVWSMLVGFLVLLALALGSARHRLVLLALTTAVIVLPLLLQIPTAAKVGLAWQGRYTLPLAVGVVLLAALVVGAAIERHAIDLPGFGGAVLGAVLVASVVAFYWGLRRYTVGTDGPFFTVGGSWAPPFGVVPVLVANLVLELLFVVLLLRGIRAARPHDQVEEPPAHRDLANVG